MIQAPSSPLVISVGPLKLDFTLCACGAMIRNRARPSELICGYCLPPWFKDEGLKSSTAGWVVCPEAGRFAVTSNRARDNSAVLIEILQIRPLESDSHAVTINRNLVSADVSAENLLHEVVQVISPLRRIVGMGIDIPDVRHVVFFQISMHALADVDQAILVAAGDPQQLELLGLVRVRQKLLRRLRIWRRRETADPCESIDVCQAKVQRLSAAH